MNQKALWSDPKIRAARLPAAEQYLGRTMEMEGHGMTKEEVKRIGRVALIVLMSPLIIIGATVGYGLWLLLVAPEQRRREMERYRFDD